ncbi:Cysteine desulfurase [Acidisarcina polymorpha]|uniref:cysteine desulfurase n=2 Tax=Acidisarcina polymorpha TaxID=2211140 RepID=A0A2Z5FVH6_9BACT|nr:Cysteine desulfurase [Acidisarcina polymorpha]
MDANATTPLALEVFEAMRPYMVESFGNASSIHYHGRHARGAVEQARASVAALLHCSPSEVVFTSGGTEGDNLALFGLVQPGDHVITTAIEHHAVLHAAERLQQRGVEVTFVRVGSDCVVDPADIRHALQPNTRLISVMMANNETGAIQPVEEIGCIAAEADAYFHSDAVQAAGKLTIDVEKIGCDLLTIAGHKMYGPQGAGALFVRRETRLEPLFFGGSHERQRRAGTENVAGIVGLGKAAQLALHAIDQGAPAHIAALRDRLETGILQTIETAGINSGHAHRVPNTTNVWFDEFEGESLAIALDLKGLAVSGGSACSSGASEASHVLTAMGLPPKRAQASLRFSLTKDTSQNDVDFALDLIGSVFSRLHEVSSVPLMNRG